MTHAYHEQVRDHYERFPYPTYSWFSLGSWKQLESVDLKTWGIEGKIENAWIAGCGTIAPLMFGRRNPETAFFCTDLSEKSLRQLKWRLFLQGIRNVKSLAEDIMMSNYREQFDAVDCYGVLHHNFSPAHALKKLTDALRPGGVLRLMVYRRKARQEIEELRAKIVQKGLKNISDLKKEIKSAGLSFMGDLSNSSGIADALLNPVVHTYDNESFDRLIESEARLKLFKFDETSNFIAFLKRI